MSTALEPVRDGRAGSTSDVHVGRARTKAATDANRRRYVRRLAVDLADRLHHLDHDLLLALAGVVLAELQLRDAE